MFSQRQLCAVLKRSLVTRPVLGHVTGQPNMGRLGPAGRGASAKCDGGCRVTSPPRHLLGASLPAVPSPGTFPNAGGATRDTRRRCLKKCMPHSFAASGSTFHQNQSIARHRRRYLRNQSTLIAPPLIPPPARVVGPCLPEHAALLRRPYCAAHIAPIAPATRPLTPMP